MAKSKSKKNSKKTSRKKKAAANEIQQELIFDAAGNSEAAAEAETEAAAATEVEPTAEVEAANAAETETAAEVETEAAAAAEVEAAPAAETETAAEAEAAPAAETGTAAEVKTETAAEVETAPGVKVIKAEDYQPIVWMYDDGRNDEQAENGGFDPSDESRSGSADRKESAAAPVKGPDKEHYEEPYAGTNEEPDETDAESAAEWIDAPDGVIPSKKAPVSNSTHIAAVFGGVFTAILVLTFVLNIIIPDKTYSDQENRVFQSFPSFSISKYLSGRFESQLDNYANDQFAGRNLFIKIKSACDLSIGQLKANGVFKAKDNYLIEDITYPDKAGYEADIEALRKFKKKYKVKKMYFMLVPNAANIMQDKLPKGVTTRDQNADMDRLFEAVEKLGYKTIDVRDELTQARKKTQVYYRTDHHWTTDGAYAAYKKAAKVMNLKSDIKYKPYVVKKDFVGTLYSKSGFTNGKNDSIKIYLPDDKKALKSVIRYKDTKEKTTKYYVMSNLDKKDAYTVFGGTNQSLFSITTPTKKNRNLLVIKDSYANCFIPFLTQDYRTITVVDPRYYYENIATVIKANDIDEVLFLYNANTYFSDNYMRMMLTNK